MTDLRDPIQDRAVQAYLDIPGKAGTILMGTGLGKSVVGIRLLERLIDRESRMTAGSWVKWSEGPSRERPNSILILVDSERNRDIEWENAMSRAGWTKDHYTIECYQTAYKWKHKKFWCVIADEFDFSLTTEYSQFYFYNSYYHLIALTATIADSKRELAEAIAPVCFRYSTQEGQENGLLNKTKFYQVNFDLSQAKALTIKTKTSSFKQSENGAYVYLEEKFDQAMWGLGATRKKIGSADIIGEDTESLKKQLGKLENQMKLFSRKRKEFLHTLESSAEVTRKLIAKISANPGNKILIFSKLTAQAEKFGVPTYHSKSPAHDAGNIRLLDEGTLKRLAVCEAVNRGANLNGVNNIIEESYIGSDTDFQQKHGRGVRLPVDKTLRFFILMPHYWVRVNTAGKDEPAKWEWQRFQTQAGTWFKNMTEKFDLSAIEQIDVEHDPRTNSYTIPSKYDNIFTSS